MAFISNPNKGSPVSIYEYRPTNIETVPTGDCLGVMTSGGQSKYTLSVYGSGQFSVNPNNNSVPDNTMLLLNTMDGQPTRIVLDTYNSTNVFGSSFRARRARGTSLTPSAVQKDDVLLQLVGDGYDGSGYVNAKVSTVFYANEDWVYGSGGGTYITFRTTPSGSTAVGERVRIDHDGKVGIASDNPRYTLDVSGSGNFTQGIYSNGSPLALTTYVNSVSGSLNEKIGGGGLTQQQADSLYLNFSGGLLTGSLFLKKDITAMEIFDNTVANRGILYLDGGPLAREYAVGPAWWSKQVVSIMPAATTTQTLIGCTATNAGTLSHVLDPYYGYMTNYATAATINTQAGTSVNVVNLIPRATVSGRNGTFLVSRFALTDATGTYATTGTAVNPTGLRFFLGVTDQTLAVTLNTTNPAGNYAGFQFCRCTGVPSRTDGTFKFVYKNNSVQTIQDCGMTFNSGLYQGFIFFPSYPNTGSIYWQLYNYDNSMKKISVSGVTTGTLLPLQNTQMRAAIGIANGSTAAKNIRTQILYTEV